MHNFNLQTVNTYSGDLQCRGGEPASLPPPLAKDWRSHKLRRYGGGEALGEAIAPPRRKGFVPVGEFRHFGRGLLVGSML